MQSYLIVITLTNNILHPKYFDEFLKFCVHVFFLSASEHEHNQPGLVFS